LLVRRASQRKARTSIEELVALTESNPPAVGCASVRAQLAHVAPALGETARPTRQRARSCTEDFATHWENRRRTPPHLLDAAGKCFVAFAADDRIVESRVHTWSGRPSVSPRWNCRPRPPPVSNFFELHTTAHKFALGRFEPRRVSIVFSVVYMVRPSGFEPPTFCSGGKGYARKLLISLRRMGHLFGEDRCIRRLL